MVYDIPGSHYSRKHRSDIEGAVYADGVQRFTQGFDYSMPATMKLSRLSLDDEQWFLDHMGEEFILTTPLGAIEKVIIGDLTVDQEARRGDEDANQPMTGSLVLHRLGSAVRY